MKKKRNHIWCELGHDSRSGVKEGGTGLLDLNSGVKKKKINQQIHRITKHMLKKIKTEIDRKKIIPGVSWDTIQGRV